MENIEAMLCAYIEGDLDEAGRADIEKHLLAHPHHRKLIDELIATRNLVRNLPRVPAPADVAESLRGHVERSALLDEEAAQSRPPRLRFSRWPQFAAVAAVFLLTAGLGLLVFKMVMPTFRAPPVSMVVMPKATAPGAVESAAEPAEAPHTISPTEFGAMAPRAAEAAHASAAGGGAAAPETIAGETSLSAAGTLTLGDDRSPVYLVIDTPNPSMTNDKITNFMNNNNIKWGPIPATNPTAADVTDNSAADTGVRFDASQLPATTQPSALNEEQKPNALASMVAAAPPASQRSSRAMMRLAANPLNQLQQRRDFDAGEDVFLAHNMTRKHAAQLRQELTQPEVGTVAEYEGSESPDLGPAKRP